MSAGPQVGDPAPLFELPDAFRKNVRLESMRGSPVLLFFFPKASTPG